MRNLIAVAFVVLFFLSCAKKKAVPDGILSPQKMQLVFWDYMRADAFAKEFVKNDSLQSDTTENMKLQNRIFGYYKISREDFYKSYNYYTVHPELMNGIMDSIIAKQNRQKLQLRIKKQ